MQHVYRGQVGYQHHARFAIHNYSSSHFYRHILGHKTTVSYIRELIELFNSRDILTDDAIDATSAPLS